MMTDTKRSDLDDFLGTRPVPVWRRHGKWVLVALGMLLLLLLLRSLFFGTAKTEYASETVRRGSLSVSVSATGKLAPTNQVEVGSELSGLVTKVVVDVNDRVTKGQPLALVDPSRFQDTVNQSKAALNAAQAAVAQNQATLAQSSAQLARLEEVSRLSGGRVPAKTELGQAVADRDRAVANLRAAQANVASARATLSSNATQLVKTVIRSPVNGVVLARQIEPGQTVAASFSTPTLFVIAEDLSAMKLAVAIDEADVGSVKQGQSASFTVDAKKPIIIRLAAAGTARLTFDGVDLDKSDDVHGSLRFDRLASKVDASAGSHLIAAKICTGALEDSGRVRLRVTDDKGAPLKVASSANTMRPRPPAVDIARALATKAAISDAAEG